MKNVYYTWIEANQKKFINSNISWKRDEIEMLFETLSDITGKKHKATGCNRCISNARNVIWKAFQEETARRNAESLE